VDSTINIANVAWLTICILKTYRTRVNDKRVLLASPESA